MGDNMCSEICVHLALRTACEVPAFSIASTSVSTNSSITLMRYAIERFRSESEDYRESMDIDEKRSVLGLRNSQRRQPSIIGFVHTPEVSTVDGVMVTIAYSRRGEQHGRPWGFLSDTCQGHGFRSPEEAMRAAERAFLPPALSMLGKVPPTQPRQEFPRRKHM